MCFAAARTGAAVVLAGGGEGAAQHREVSVRRRSQPRTHKKFVILRIFLIKFDDFVKIWNLVKLVKFEILNPSENQNLRSLTLDHKIWILTTKISFFDQN